MSDDIFKFDPKNWPSYAPQIMARLEELDWLAHAFVMDEGDSTYNPEIYRHHFYHSESTYIVVLDTNIYQFILSAYKNENKLQVHRDAIALVVFCMFCNILVNPTIAVHEKVNFNGSYPESVIDDLVTFRKLDDADMNKMAEFALGNTDTLPLSAISVDRAEIKTKIDGNMALSRFNTFKLYILKIIDIHYQNKIPRAKKAQAFLDWCFSDFVYSTPATALAIYFFTGPTKAKIMKYQSTMIPQQKPAAVANMAWDLYYPAEFFREWGKNSKTIDYICCSDDKGLKNMLRFAIKIQGYCDNFISGDTFEPKEVELIKQHISGSNTVLGREKNLDPNTFQERKATLIAELEIKLGITDAQAQ
jgi:hypothetical protein